MPGGQREQKLHKLSPNPRGGDEFDPGYTSADAEPEPFCSLPSFYFSTIAAGRPGFGADTADVGAHPVGGNNWLD